MTLFQSAKFFDHFDRDISPRRALDWLNHYGGYPVAGRLECFSDVINLTKSNLATSRRYRTDVWHERPIHW